MKRSLVTILALAVAVVHGDELETAGREYEVHLRPDRHAPAIGMLEKGDRIHTPDEPVLLGEQAVADGWKAISLSKTYTGYVANRHITKDLTVRSGSALFLEPRSDPDYLLAVVEKPGDAEVVGLDGDWTVVEYRTTLTGFIHQPPRLPSRQARQERVQPMNDDPVIDEPGAIPTDGISRLYQGEFRAARTLFQRRPPYDYQLVDSSGNRIVFLDTGQLLKTTALQRLLERDVIAFGVVERIPDSGDGVLRIETIRVR